MSGLDEPNHFALVSKPPSALEKVSPGAKRILSGIVTDLLALVKTDLATRPAVSAVLCGICPADFYGEMLQQFVAPHGTMELICLTWTNELIEAAQDSQFDLFVLVLNPRLYSSKASAERVPWSQLNFSDHGNEMHACELIGSLKSKYAKPVFVISNAVVYKSIAELEKAGADAVFFMPFSPHEFGSAFQRHVTTRQASITDNHLTRDPD